ncbi:hypothetical protein HH214_18330 [Mucilaginibacter robiniae]|uniref:Uncharacterized protein n=1 Tax=Mucilaginibacter robiniae TaxID=2728022 RepID=A0A7L5E5U9_9SPHI|nr:hypothetical protein [Mucilaginibacter robiniae]QJD97689.1 hypothetical protein HH214_18330 [Mucilaginibacter robiniae]
MIIDWNKLQPYKTTKSKSFEQLCYQIASRLYSDKGTFTPVDDSGGGDGVEFYLTMPDGSEWGWQAKYYEGSARLSVSGRKAAIISSLERAVNKHPKMEMWFLCVTTDLTPDEETWVTTDLKNRIPAGHPAKIEVWNESFLHEKINQPAFNGLKQSFFNELELSSDWFAKAYEKSFSIVKNKFDDLLYVPNGEFEYYYVNPILCNDKFVEQRIAYYPRKLEELLGDAKEKLESLHYTTDLWRPLLREYIDRYTKFNLAAESLLPVLKARLENITPNNFEKLVGDEYENEIAYFESIKNGLEEFRRNWQQNNAPELTEDLKKSNLEQSKKIWPVESVYKEFIEELKYYVSHSRMPVEWRSAHYLGNGGDGKTNFAVALVKEYLSTKIPAIYIPAIEFTGANPLTDQILTTLDIKSGYTFGDFLDCLNELGKIHNKRIPVVIDGLNEAINAQGFLNDRLPLDLPQIEVDFLHRKNLVLLTTCRTSYKEAIWGEVTHNDKRFHSLYGFTNQEDKKKLVRNYFSQYKIQADLSFLSLERFTKPLYLKLFCESINSERKEVKQVTLGFDSIYSIFENFVGLCDDNIFKRIKKAGKLAPTTANKKLASKVLAEIAGRLWRQHQRAFLLDDLMTLADGQTKPDYKDSVTKALLDEELLFIRNWHNGEEHIFLTYDLMAGYFIAKHLVDTVSDFTTFFKDEQMESLIGDDYDKLHPNHEDITDGLCSLLPIKKGIFVHDLITKPGKDHTQSQVEKMLFERSIAATILLSPEYITSEQVGYFTALSLHSKNLIRLISLSEDVLFVSNHPFNFKFWSVKLAGLPMNERDIIWSEYLRSLREGFLDDLITEFEALQTSASLTQEQNEKIYLVADYLKWTFTSTNKDLKGKAGDALYQFAIKFPVVFLTEFYNSAKINDPSVFEWMMVILYNTCIYLVKNNKENHKYGLLKLSAFLQKEVLNPGGAYATNHLVTRNYAYSILKLLTRKYPEAAIDIEEVRKKFKNIGIIAWEEAEDLNKGEYRDGNALIDYYFNKEKMPYISRGRGNEYNRTPEFLAVQAKLRWRAYQLGYKFELFGEPDIQIAKYKHWGESFASTERYADKYIEIAFLEYCGYLDGLDDLESYDDIGYLRTFKLKHDPSETGDVDEPVPLPRFVEKDFIDANISLSKWCADHSAPEVSEYLERTAFQEKTGNWVLLHGLVHQHKKHKERQFYFKVDTVFVKNKDLIEARLAFSDKTELGRANNSIPYTNNIHESEIPDADSIPYNEFTEWNYSLESEIIDREYTRIVLIENGKRLKEKESDQLWDMIIKQLHFLTHPRTNLSGFSMPMIRFKAPGADGDESLEDAFRRMNIELKEEKFTKQEPREIDKTIDVFIPVRYHKDKVYLCKNMIDELELSSPYGITDLNDRNGELASFNYTYEVEYVDQETFTYLRKDLLDKYLLDNELTLFQIIWGERDYYPIDGNWNTDRKRAQTRKWAPFYRAVEYKI